MVAVFTFVDETRMKLYIIIIQKNVILFIIMYKAVLTLKSADEPSSLSTFMGGTVCFAIIWQIKLDTVFNYFFLPQGGKRVNLTKFKPFSASHR